MDADKNQSDIDAVLKTIAQGRERTNLLRKWEQRTIAYFVQRLPSWMTSNMLTGIGFFGSIVTFLSFVLAHYVHGYCLLIGVLGFFISWFGDSLDGRVAYYRNKPRKWYGFSLDFTIDWIGIVLMGMGFIVYVSDVWEIIGFLFVVLYGWEMMTALLRYKVTNKYSIDSGLLGPTEARVVISAILVLEVFVNTSIIYSSALACVILFISNILETNRILKLADIQDKEENRNG
mgnify:FL=1